MIIIIASNPDHQAVDMASALEEFSSLYADNRIEVFQNVTWNWFADNSRMLTAWSSGRVAVITTAPDLYDLQGVIPNSLIGTMREQRQYTSLFNQSEGKVKLLQMVENLRAIGKSVHLLMVA